MKDETTNEGSVTSPKELDVENVPQHGNDVTNNENNSEPVKKNKPVQRSAKLKQLTVSYSSPMMKMKDGTDPEKEEAFSSSPIAPVKHTVTRFGGIVDWKAHKQHTLERRKFIQLELEKATAEIPVFRKQCEAAAEEKHQLFKKLNSTKRVNEDLKLNLERAYREEEQARQDADLAILRVEELEKGIADESSVVCKVQLEVAMARYDAAVYDLKKVQDELEQLQRDFTLLSAEKESALMKARKSMAKSKEVEKSLEDSSIELINTKDELESAQAAHLEAEEQRAEQIPALEQDALKFENELREAEEELEKLNHKFSSAKNVKAQLVTSLELLQKLKCELDVYMESSLKKERDENEEKNRAEIEAAVKSAKMELQETQANISKAIDEIKTLKDSVSLLNAELETQTYEINKMVKLPEIQEATHEGDEAKLLVELRREEYSKAKEEAREANSEKNMVENRLLTAQKEIQLSKGVENLVLDSINMQQESESSETMNEEDSQTKVTLTLEEYYEHNMQALEAEDDAKKKVLIAHSEVDAAKESELKSIDKLEEINNDISHLKKQLEIELQKVNIAKEGQLNAEEALQKWRTEQQEIQKEATKLHQAEQEKEAENSANKTSEPSNSISSLDEEKPTKKKKRFIFPRFLMFMGRKKSSSKSPS